MLYNWLIYRILVVVVVLHMKVHLLQLVKHVHSGSAISIIEVSQKEKPSFIGAYKDICGRIILCSIKFGNKMDAHKQKNV